MNVVTVSVPSFMHGLQKHTLALEAVERCITLFMILGNLHWFTAATCPPELKVRDSSSRPGAD